MSEAEILRIIQSLKDKQLADLIRSHLSDPHEAKLLLILTRLGVVIGAEKVTLISNVIDYIETDDYDAEVHLQLGGIIICGTLFVLELVYNKDYESAKIQLKQTDHILLQLIDMGEKRED